MEFGVTRRTQTVSGSVGPSTTRFCMICLDTSEDCKLYPAEASNNLDIEFEHLTGISLGDKLNFVPHFCTVCAQTLSKCGKFRNKGLKAYHLLMGLLEITELLTIQNIKMLRTSNNLTSSMGKRSFQPDHCDLYLIHQEHNNDKTVKIEIVDRKLVLCLDPGNETFEIRVDNVATINELNKKIKTEKLGDSISDVEYVEEIDNHDDTIYTDVDIDIDIDVKRDESDEEVEVADINVPKRDNLDDPTSDVELLEDIDMDGKCDKKVEEIKKVVPKTNVSTIEEIHDLTSDSEFLEDIDDIVFSDAECDKRVKDKVDKFINDINNDTDNDWVLLKNSNSQDSDSGAVNSKGITKNVEVPPTNTESKIRGTQKCSSKSKTKVRERKIRKTRPVNDEGLEYLNNYIITELTHEEQLANIRNRTKTANFITSPYKCMKCFKGFCNIDIYNTHKEKHTDKFGTRECLVCGARFKLKCQVRHHVISVHSKRYTCKRCPLVTSYKRSAIEHARWHEGVTFKCPHCPSQIRSKTGYLSHLRIFHPADVVCALCGFCFLTKSGLRFHLTVSHRGETVENLDGPLCEECDVRFASKTAYEQHLGVSPKHKAEHTSKRNAPSKEQTSDTNILSCELCGMQLIGSKSYEFHFKRIHPNAAPLKLPDRKLCEQCGSFWKDSHLKNHLLQHTGKRQFHCNICKKSFFSQRDTRVHMRLHVSRSTFECPICQKKFNTKANCKRHTWTHQDLKPYKCEECDKTFVDTSSVHTHVQHAHRHKPYPKKSRGPKLRASRARDVKDAVYGLWPEMEQATSFI